MAGEAAMMTVVTGAVLINAEDLPASANWEAATVEGAEMAVTLHLKLAVLGTAKWAEPALVIWVVTWTTHIGDGVEGIETGEVMHARDARVQGEVGVAMLPQLPMANTRTTAGRRNKRHWR